MLTHIALLALAMILREPTPKGWVFHRSPAYETLFAGVKGTHKSTALYEDPVRLYLGQENDHFNATGVPSSAWFCIFRKDHQKLKELRSEALAFYREVDKGGTYHGEEHVFRFSCGMRVEFGHLQDANSEQGYNGRNWWGLYIDEAEEVPEYQYRFLRAMVRSTDPRHPPEKWRIKLTANPAGAYADWLEAYFVKPGGESGGVFIPTVNELPDGTTWRTTRVYIPATMSDSRLSAAYYANLQQLPEHLVKAYVYGIWGVGPGSYFGGIFKPDIHVCRPFVIPPNWAKFRSGDSGFKDKFPIHWHAVDQNGEVWTYRELTLEGHTARMAANRIREVEMDAGEWQEGVDLQDPGHSRIPGVLSPDAFIGGKQVVGLTSAQIMNTLGCRWAPANNARIQGWEQVADYLIERKWHIFQNCTRLIETLPKLQSDPKEPADIASHEISHWAESCRYALQSRPKLGRKDPDKMSDIEWSEEQYQRANRKRQRSKVTGYAWLVFFLSFATMVVSA